MKTQIEAKRTEIDEEKQRQRARIFTLDAELEALIAACDHPSPQLVFYQGFLVGQCSVTCLVCQTKVHGFPDLPSYLDYPNHAAKCRCTRCYREKNT